MRLFFARLNNKEQLGRQFENNFYQAQKGSSYFAELNEIDFAVENVYVFAFCGGKIELWKPHNWAADGSRLHFTKIGTTISIEIQRFASIRYFFLNLDLIIYPIRRPKRKAFFEIRYDAAFTEAMLLDSDTYHNVANFRKIEVFDTEVASQAADPLSLVMYRKNHEWQFKAPHQFENELVQHFRDNTKFKEGSRPQKNKVLKLVDDASEYPLTLTPDILPIFRLYDAFFCNYKDIDEDTEEPLTAISPSDQTLMSNKNLDNLNFILYGPPGTGKTFNTINHALEIIWGKDTYEKRMSDWTRPQLTESFRQSLIDMNDKTSDGQIGFVTFHQSMNYEDFVEGIKPVDPKYSQKDYLEYEVTAGIFKHISRLAATNPYTIIGDPVKSIISENDFDKKANFIKVDLRSSADKTGKVNLDYCFKNECISVFNEIEKDLSTIYTHDRPEQEAFVSKPIDDTYVIVTLDDKEVKAIGRIIGPYEYHSEQAYRHTRAATWLVKDTAIPVAEVFDPAYTEGIFCPLTRKKVKKEFFIKGSALAKNKKVIPRNYVLIIDEINRGNIAQIFGELITLIEKDKRTGFDEELSVTLPYSKESFSVPPNLFIIGTMNTADRSVEALDTALRRRFVFKEMMPQESIIMESFKKEYLSLCEKHSALIWNEDEWLTLESAYTDAIQKDEKNQQIADFKKLVNELGAIRTYQDYVNCWNKAGVRLIIVDKLEVINRRIEVLLNRDHLIGHSYLIGKYTREAIYNTFYQNIIPLLKEYFYGDYGKIGLILGNHFVAKKEQEVTSILSSFEYPGVEDFNEKSIYTIKDFKKTDGSSNYDLFYQAFCNI